MALHEQSVGATDEWYTPPYVFLAMGLSFDMDVASPGQHVTPWIPADEFLTSGSLERDWRGVVWMNAPFGARKRAGPLAGKVLRPRLRRSPGSRSHVRPWWQRFAPQSDSVLFVSPKIRFIGADGLPGASPAQGTTLLAKGPRAVAGLRLAAINGLGVCFQTNNP